MRVGQYEILLVDTNNQPFPERDIGGQIYTEGVANKEYQIKINVYRDASGCYPAPFLRFTLFIDGIEVLAKKRLNVVNLAKSADPLQPVSVTIPGYPTEARAYQSFIFTPPNVTSDPVGDWDSPLGTIRIVTCEADNTGRYEPFRNYETPKPNTQNTATISEQKKFWRQASLGTIAGERVNALPSRNNNEEQMVCHWHTIREIPEGALVLRYHLASTLDFLDEMQNRICPRGYKADEHATTRVSSAAQRVVDVTRREQSSARDRSPPSRAASNGRVGEKRYRDEDVYSISSGDSDDLPVRGRTVRACPDMRTKATRGAWNA